MGRRKPRETPARHDEAANRIMMHEATIPDRDHALRPCGADLVFRRVEMIAEQLEDQPAFLLRHAANAMRELRTEIQTGMAGDRMRRDERPPDNFTARKPMRGSKRRKI